MRFPLLTKVAAMAAVMALLSAVLARIDGLASERQMRQQVAVQGVEQSLASAQTLLGPLLLRNCREEWDSVVGEGRTARRQSERRDFQLAATPQTLTVGGELRAEARYRGLFKVNGYAGQLQVEARWSSLAALQAQREHAGSRLSCGPVLAMLGVTDVRGLRAAQAQADGERLAVAPGTGHGRHTQGLHVELPAARSDSAEPLALGLTLDLVGTARLLLVPASGQTHWTLRSDWPHPSFIGRFLPATRAVDAQGFRAEWQVSALASPAAAAVLRNGELCAPAALEAGSDGAPIHSPPSPGANCLDTLGVAFIDPVNPYVLSDRALKYALLFIVLTFACVALTELLARRRVHPVQYTLVGLALALFFLLLLSLSEHLAFGTAYAAASLACVALLGFYAAHMLASRRAGAAFGAGIALLYGALWVLLQLEQTALVIGALLLFGVLAAVMVVTRRIDWYALFEGLRRGGTATAP